MVAIMGTQLAGGHWRPAFHRIKVGVGKPVPGEVSGWVFRKMSKDELEHLGSSVITDVSIDCGP